MSDSKKISSIREFFSKKQLTIPGFIAAFVTGNVTYELIKSFVSNILMPLLGLFLSKKSFENLNFKGLRLGSFLSSFITWIITLTVLYIFIEFILEKIVVEEVDPQLKAYKNKYEENYYDEILTDYKGDIYKEFHV